MMPNRAIAAISRLVAIGRRMKCSEMFTAMVDGPKYLFAELQLYPAYQTLPLISPDARAVFAPANSGVRRRRSHSPTGMPFRESSQSAWAGGRCGPEPPALCHRARVCRRGPEMRRRCRVAFAGLVLQSAAAQREGSFDALSPSTARSI